MKKIIMVILIMMMTMSGCTVKEVHASPPQEYPSLSFNDMDGLIRCLESDGKTGDDKENANVEVDIYPFLKIMKETQKIPTLVTLEGKNALFPDDGEFISMNGPNTAEVDSGNYHQPFILSYSGKILDVPAKVHIYYLSNEFLNSVEKPNVFEYHLYKGWGHNGSTMYMFRESVQFGEERHAAYVWKENSYRDLSNTRRNHVEFICGHYLLDIYATGSDAFVLTDEFLSQVTMGYVEIESRVSHEVKFLRACRPTPMFDKKINYNY